MSEQLRVSRTQFERIAQLLSKVGSSEIELETRLTNPVDVYQFNRLVKYYEKNGLARSDAVLGLDIVLEDGTRATLDGAANIKKFCENGAMDAISGIQKKTLDAEALDEYDIKIKLSQESPLEAVEVQRRVRAALSVNGARVYYRLKQRTSFTMSPEYRMDLTMVRSNAVRVPTPLDKVSYEVEIELNHDAAARSGNPAALAKSLLLMTYEALKVVENSTSVLPKSHIAKILTEYSRIAFQLDKPMPLDRMLRSPKLYFAGPQPVSFELQHMMSDEFYTSYTVTHKADGERALIFCDNIGDVYLLNNRLKLQRLVRGLTGAKSSLFDCEVLNIKDQRKIFIFDAYVVNGKHITALRLTSSSSSQSSPLESRLAYAQQFADALKDKIDIQVKKFLSAETSQQFYDACKTFLTEQASHTLSYETDGLIFTPNLLPVGANAPGDKAKLNGTWYRVYKWKPPIRNSIDFLVRFRPGVSKGADGKTVKVMDLYVGGDIKPTTPWEFLTTPDVHQKKGYAPVVFAPASPYDDVSICKVPITASTAATLCANGDTIMDEAIVEMSWNTADSRWEPLLVRHDKTELYRITRNIAGAANDRDIAERIWSTILHPVSEGHLVGNTRLETEEIVTDETKYYNRTVDRVQSAAYAMIDFHNFWVKRRHLLERFYNVTATVCDIGCGKGGDLNKWIDARFKVVLGVDLFSDNICNPKDGIYARLLDRVQAEPMLATQVANYIFLPMDASQKFTPEYFKAIDNPEVRALAQVLWGTEKASVASLNKYYGLVQKQFELVTSQFTVHYFFENDTTLSNFCHNVNQLLKPGGYFIGTCFDGHLVEHALEGVQKGGAITGTKDGRRVWAIRKEYDKFESKRTGHKISVYFETINQFIDEYLVDFGRLQDELKQYGISVLTPRECAALKLQESHGNFRRLFANLQNVWETEQFNNPPMWLKRAIGMQETEKTFSFLNMWFVFRKKLA